MAVWRDLLIGAAGSVLGYYAIKGFERYLTRRTVKSRQAHIKQVTQEIELLEKLGVSDRSLSLFAFQFLFLVIALAAVGVAGSLASSWLQPGQTFPILLLVSIFIAILSFYASTLFRKLEDPQPTLAKLRQRLRELEGMDEKSGA